MVTNIIKPPPSNLRIRQYLASHTCKWMWLKYAIKTLHSVEKSKQNLTNLHYRSSHITMVTRNCPYHGNLNATTLI